MPALTQIIVALAAVVIAAEFYLVFRIQRDRRIIERLNEKGE